MNLSMYASISRVRSVELILNLSCGQDEESAISNGVRHEFAHDFSLDDRDSSGARGESGSPKLVICSTILVFTPEGQRQVTPIPRGRR